MLMPKRTKYRKQQKGQPQGPGLSRLERVVRRLRAADARRRVAHLAPDRGRSYGDPARDQARAAGCYIRVFPDKPLSKKPLETRMGKGKGGVEVWVAVVKPGRVLYELEGIPKELAKEAFALAAAKLPVRTRDSWIGVKQL